MNNVLKQPLIHFLLVGGLFFGGFELLATNTSDIDDTVIQVNKDDFLTFLQFRSKAFNEEVFEEKFNAMSEDEKQAQLKDLIREEALYREAKRMGLDENDYIIKQRMVQKLDFISQGFGNAMVDITDEKLASFYEENKQKYFIPASMTFTHVFFKHDMQDKDKALQLANAAKQKLNQEQVHFSEGFKYGERFPYHVNYVEKGEEFIATHFGASMADQVIALKADDTTWVGPFKSRFGQHLVMVSNKVEGRIPELEQVKDKVFGHLHRKELIANTDKANQTIIDSYKIELADDLLTTELTDAGAE